MLSRRALLPSLGFFAVLGILVTNVVGQGVFLKGRSIACEVGNAGADITVWIVAGAIALCGTLSVAELATMMPQSGGTYVFARRAFGEPTGFVLGWVQLLVATPASIGALASGTAILFDRATGNTLGTIPHGQQWFAVALIAVLTVVNCAPVRANGTIATVSAAIKVVMLAGIACAGFFIAAHGAAITPHAFVATPCPDVASALRGGGAGFAAALLGASYAFGGWSNITAIAGEIREPTRTLPRAMTGAVLLVIALYAVANAAFVRTIGFEAIRHISPQSSLGIVVAEALLGSGWATISSALLCVSVAATLHVAILGTSRTTFALAKDGLVFPALARLSPSGVPQLAVLGTSTLAIVLVTLMGFERLSNYYVFNSWLILALTVVGLIVLRRREPTAPRPYRTVGYPFVPVAYLVAVSYVLVVTVISDPNDAVIGIAIALSGIPAYAVLARAKRRRANAANASLAPDVP